MMIAERSQASTDIVRAGVTAEELERIVALAGFTPTRGESTLADDDHPLAVAAQIAASAVIVRVVALLAVLIAVGAITGVLA